MSARKPKGRVKLTPYREIRPLPAGKQLNPTRAPMIPMGKFTHIDGQMVLDFAEDEASEE